MRAYVLKDKITKTTSAPADPIIWGSELIRMSPRSKIKEKTGIQNRV